MKNIFWNYVKRLHGVNGFLQEKFFFRDVKRVRKLCEESKDPYYAIERSYFFDKQYFLQKWWDKLEYHEKKELLFYVWGAKVVNVIYGNDWWLPFFKELGFISNCGAKQPKDEVVLYRASEEEFKSYMSWTADLQTAVSYQKIKPPIPSKVNVYKTTVRPSAVLAIVDGTFWVTDGYNVEGVLKGNEYIVNHNKLSNIKEVDTDELCSNSIKN